MIYPYPKSLVKYDKEGNLLKKLIDDVYGISPYGLFYGANDTLYIADAGGRIMYIAPDNEVVDTLVHRFEDDNIKADYVYHLTGDNNGNLYISSGSFGYGITKYNLHEKKSEIIFIEPDNNSPGTITYHDGRIFVCATKNFYSFKTDGSDVKHLIKNKDNFSRKYGMVFYEKLNKFIMSGIDDMTKLCLMDINGTYTAVKFENENTNNIFFIAVDNSGDLIVNCSNTSKIEIK
jgi:hypothetical protein